MSKLAPLEEGPYQAPDNAVDFGERYADGKAFLLYIGEQAIVDVVVCPDEHKPDELGAHLLRVMDAPEKGPAMLNHTPLFVPEEVAQQVFSPSKIAA